MDGKIIKEILKYFIPVCISYLFFATSTLIDGIFISSKFGESGVAAMSIVQPFYLVAYAFAYSLQIGSQTYVGMLIGMGNDKKASEAFTSLLVKAIITCITLTFVIKLASEPALKFIEEGTGSEIIGYATEYLNVYLFSIPVFGSMLIMNGCLKNDGTPKYMLLVAGLGTSINIILNYTLLFIFDVGIWGAAAATTASVFVQFFVSILYYLKFSKHLKFTKYKRNLRLYRKALINGSSDGMIDVSTAVRSILYNFILLTTIGVMGVAASGYINYAYTLFIIPLYALSDSINPFISKNFGAKNYKNVGMYRKNGLYIAVTLGIILYSVVIIFGKQVFTLFNIDNKVLFEYVIQVSVIQYTGLLFAGYNQNQIAYLTSIDYGKTSLFLSMFRNLLLISALVIVFSYYIGGNAIWYALPVTEFISAIVSYIIVKKINTSISSEML